MKKCWCGKYHFKWTWHDPTHGRIDRDLQDRVKEVYPDLNKHHRFIMGLNLQKLRDEGKTVV